MSLFKLLKESCKKEWDEYVEHPFGEKLVKNTMRKESFLEYLYQDYIYLKHYSRCYALLAYKSETQEELSYALKCSLDILEGEMSMHEDFNVMELDISNKEEHINCIAYTRYLSHIGSTGDYLDLLVALAPCTIGYGEMGLNISKMDKIENNQYQKWIDEYGSKEYQALCDEFIENLSKYESLITDERMKKLKKIFRDVVKLEINFFNIALED